MLDHLRGGCLLIAFLLLGQGLQQLGSPIPGSVAGLILLLLALCLGLVKLRWVERTARLFLRHMVLLFVPVTVGLMDAGPLLQQSGAALAVSLIVCLLVVLIVTGLLARWLLPYDSNSLVDAGPESVRGNGAAQ